MMLSGHNDVVQIRKLHDFINVIVIYPTSFINYDDEGWGSSSTPGDVQDVLISVAVLISPAPIVDGLRSRQLYHYVSVPLQHCIGQRAI